ncbi:MAG: phytanoyl-CoA dioxygenase family protein [Pseudomonadota bacterium]
MAELDALLKRSLTPDDVPLAAEIIKNVPIYDCTALAQILEDPLGRRKLMAEWARGLLEGAGALVLRGAYTDTDVVDEATAVYEAVIDEERKTIGGGDADHFAAAGSNDRVWNALQKLAERAPGVFLRYFGNAAIAAVCEAWLGPSYQMTAQINLVRPGGGSQQAHRDYHLGFQSAEAAARFPTHVHHLSAGLTLQGAVAHCDMPIESGPTKLLPFSQGFGAGYVAFRRQEFRALFEARHIQLPLAKGDALFFSPALFHAAGANSSTNIHRMANLLQVSSAFGRAMESVDRTKICSLLYPYALAVWDLMAPSDLSAAIAAAAEGYAFPTNLDSDPPKAGLAPESQAAFFARALAKGMPKDDFETHLHAMAHARRA